MNYHFYVQFDVFQENNLSPLGRAIFRIFVSKTDFRKNGPDFNLVSWNTSKILFESKNTWPSALSKFGQIIVPFSTYSSVHAADA